MIIGILDIGTDKISCFIVNITKDKTSEILGIGHHKSNGIFINFFHNNCS